MALDGHRSNLSPESRQYLERVEKRLKAANAQIASLETDVGYLKSRIAQPVSTGIGDNSVTTAKIQDGAVTDAKIVSVDGAKVTGTVATALNATDAYIAQHSDGVSWDAYNRNAVGTGFFGVWMNSALQLMRNTSSERFKENISPLEKGYEVLNLQPVEYDRIGGGHEYGLIAEQVYEYLPEIVTWFADPDSEDEPVIDGVRYDLLSVALLSVVKDLARRVEELENG